MTKAKTIEATVTIGKETRSVDLDKASVISNPSSAIESISGLIQDAVVEYAAKERDNGFDPMEDYVPPIEGGKDAVAKKPANNTSAG